MGNGTTGSYLGHNFGCYFLTVPYIPNREIRNCFKTKIIDFFSSNQEMKDHTEGFVKGLFSGECEMVENSMNELLAKYVSIRDFSTKTPKENYYHGFVSGLLVNSASLIEEQKSNFEPGNGYVDLIIKPKLAAGIIVVLELKQTSDEREDKGKIAGEAIEQIIPVFRSKLKKFKAETLMQQRFLPIF
jgi:hypothetical protein